jgi:hypothetical protein
VRSVSFLTRLGLGSFVVLALLLIGRALPAFSSPAPAGHSRLTLTRLTPTAGRAAPARPAARRAVPLRVENPAVYRQQKAAAERRYERWRQLRGLPPTTSAPTPHTAVFNGLNHAGITDAASLGVTPPDSTGAIGPSNYVEFINSEIGVYSNTDLSAPTATLDESTFVGDASASTCDPQIQWDQQGQRWLYAALDCGESANTNSEQLYLGWSKTASPTPLASNWCRYALNTGNSIEDYPKLGHDNSQIIIGTNAFNDSTFNYTGSHIFVFDKPANGVTTCPSGSTEGSTMLAATAGGSDFTPVPANIADSSATGYVVAARSYSDQSHLDLYTIGRDSGNHNVVLGTTTVTVPAFDFPANVPQQGTSDVLDPLDTRLTQAVAVTDPATGKEGIWTQHTIDGGGPSVVRWYELTPGATTPKRSGTISGPSGAFAFNGAISPTGNGASAVITYNSSSATQLPDWRAQDPTASTVQDIQLATSSYEDSDFSCPSWGYFGTAPCRWGDYAGASPDPANPCVVWSTSMLTADSPDVISGTPQWGTQNAAINAASGTCSVTALVAKAGSGSGTVTSSPAGISCGSTCSHAFTAGSSVTLTATPATGSTFSGWSGACSGTGTCNLTMNQVKAVTATFTVIPENLSVTKSGSGSGTVTSNVSGISCGSTCSHAYNYGTTVTLTASPSTGSSFTGWSGACSGTGTCTVSMTQARSVTASFSLVVETLSVAKSGKGSGTVSSSPAGITCGSTCSHAYTYGTAVTLTATAGKGSLFAGWSGACSGTGTCSVTMSNAQAVGAKFAKQTICLVPKVKGKKLKRAKRALRQAHCRPGKIRHRYSRAKKGHVIAQKPRPHRHLRKGAKVNLVVSKGKKP